LVPFDLSLVKIMTPVACIFINILHLCHCTAQTELKKSKTFMLSEEVDELSPHLPAYHAHHSCRSKFTIQNLEARQMLKMHSMEWCSSTKNAILDSIFVNQFLVS
jgi:hypothetical protein